MFGFGKDEDKDAAISNALEQARQGHPDGISGTATKFMERLLDTGIEGKGRFDSAAEVAAAALAQKGGDVEKAIDEIVKDHTIMAGTGGFLTSMGGFITLPISLPVNVLEFYLVATRMVASIAKARGYDIEQPEIRSATLLTLVGADADDLLKKAGVVATGRMSNLAAQRLPGPILMVVNKAVAFRLLTTVGKSTLGKVGKGVPVVGGFIGAGLDTYLIRRIADAARREFPAALPGGNPPTA